MQTEIWKPISGYKGYYEVSNLIQVGVTGASQYWFSISQAQ